jgi:hypothetical protein
MYFDNLTLAGLLVTLPYIVILIMFSRVKTAPDPQVALVLERSEKEAYCYGT